MLGDFGLWVACGCCFVFQLMLYVVVVCFSTHLKGDFGLCVVCDAFLFFSWCWETLGCVFYVMLFYFSAVVGKLWVVCCICCCFIFQLMLGDFGLSEGQQTAQMVMWAMWSAPLFISADLRHISAFARDLLLNKDLIAINQDWAGSVGHRVWQDPRVPVSIPTKSILTLPVKTGCS